jgi:hypothetical protein
VTSHHGRPPVPTALLYVFTPPVCLVHQQLIVASRRRGRHKRAMPVTPTQPRVINGTCTNRHTCLSLLIVTLLMMWSRHVQGPERGGKHRHRRHHRCHHGPVRTQVLSPPSVKGPTIGGRRQYHRYRQDHGSLRTVTTIDEMTPVRVLRVI